MPKNSIDEYKDRMASPIGVMLLDPETGEPTSNPKSEQEELSHSQLVDGMYVEPKSYFTKEMLEAAEEYDKKHGTDTI